MPKKRNNHIGVLFAVGMYLVAPVSSAADETSVDKPRVVILCPECGIVSNIRRIERPVSPERNTLPSISSAPRAGGMGSETQAVPLFSIGRSGAQRVQREPATRPVWEITVRYDNGQFGFVTQDSEPELRINDRVRNVENTLEPVIVPAR